MHVAVRNIPVLYYSGRTLGRWRGLYSDSFFLIKIKVLNGDVPSSRRFARQIYSGEMACSNKNVDVVVISLDSKTNYVYPPLFPLSTIGTVGPLLPYAEASKRLPGTLICKSVVNPEFPPIPHDFTCAIQLLSPLCVNYIIMELSVRPWKNTGCSHHGTL